jgi:cysteinyl-tRNA synthetase
MHNGMLEMRGEKMAKSVGNIALLPEVVERWGRDALLLFFAGGHYRQPIVFGPDTMDQAAAGARRIREAAKRLEDGPGPEDLAPLKERFFAALAEDFNTARALAAVYDYVREINRRDEPAGRDDLAEMLGIFGLDNLLESEEQAVPREVEELAHRRQEARAAKDFGEADRLRDELAARGWAVRDTPDGYALEPA